MPEFASRTRIRVAAGRGTRGLVHVFTSGNSAIASPAAISSPFWLRISTRFFFFFSFPPGFFFFPGIARPPPAFFFGFFPPPPAPPQMVALQKLNLFLFFYFFFFGGLGFFLFWLRGGGKKERPPPKGGKGPGAAKGPPLDPSPRGVFLVGLRPYGPAAAEQAFVVVVGLHVIGGFFLFVKLRSPTLWGMGACGFFFLGSLGLFANFRIGVGFLCGFSSLSFQRITNGLPVTAPVLIQTLFTCRYSRMASIPFSRPRPESL